MNEDFLDHDHLRARRGRLSAGERFEHRSRAYGEVWIAGATLAVTAASAAYSAYSSSSAQDAEAEYRAGNTPKFKPYTPVLAEYNPDGAAQGYMNLVNAQGANAQQTAGTLNSYFQEGLATLNPKLKQNAILASRLANSYLKGEVPRDQAQATARAAAQANLTSGFAPDSGQAQNRTLRDFGVLSMDAQKYGAQLATQNAALAASLNPYNVTSVLGTGTDFGNRYDRYQLYNASVLNDAAKDNAGVGNQNRVNEFQAGLAQTQANAINPAVNAGVSLAGSVAAGAGNVYQQYQRQNATPNAYGYGGGYNLYGQQVGPQYNGAINWGAINSGVG